MKKPTKTVRFGKKFVRLSLNPILLGQMGNHIHWKSAISEARKRYPHVPLSWAVEGYLVDSTLKGKELQHQDQAGVGQHPPLEVARFQNLTPGEKIRQVLKWKEGLERIRRMK